MELLHYIFHSFVLISTQLILNSHQHLFQFGVGLRVLPASISSVFYNSKLHYNMLNRTLPKYSLSLLKLEPNKDSQSLSKPKPSSLLKEMRHFIAQILDFDDESNNSQQIVKYFRSQNLGTYEILRLWDQALTIELLKFTARVNSLKAIKKIKNFPHYFSGIILKLEKLSKKMIQLIELIVRNEELCLCERNFCPSRIIPEVTQRRIQQYVLGKLAKETFPQENEAKEPQSFFSSKNDEQCHILSLQKLSEDNHMERKDIFISIQKQAAEESIVSYLQSLRIVNQDRKVCYLDSSWLQDLVQKYST